MIIKYKCDDCGNVEVYSNKEKFLIFVYKLIIALLAGLGLFLVVFALIVSPNKLLDGFIYSYNNKDIVSADDFEVRNSMINITKGSGCSNSFCYAKVLFDNVSSIDYVPKSLTSIKYPPLYTYKNGGDCETLSKMYSYFLNSFGVTSWVDCNIAYNHCVSVVKFKDWTSTWDYNGSVVVDLTIPKMVLLRPGERVWDYESFFVDDARRGYLNRLINYQRRIGVYS